LYNGEDCKNFGIIVLHSRYCPISDIIFKQQVRKIYVKINKKTSNYFDFHVQLQITFEKHSILRPLDRDGSLNLNKTMKI